jgi:hypothetical protein
MIACGEKACGGSFGMLEFVVIYGDVFMASSTFKANAY